MKTQKNVLLAILSVLLIFSVGQYFLLAIAEPTDLIYSWNYTTGTLGRETYTSYYSGSSYSFEPDAVRLTSSSTESSSSYLTYRWDKNTATVKVEMEFTMRTLPTTLYSSNTLIRVGTVTVWVQNNGGDYNWRLTLPGASISSYTTTANIDQKYEVSLSARIGNGNAEAIVELDGEQILSATGGLIEGLFTKFDYGLVWAQELSQVVDVHSVKVYGTEAVFRTISGAVTTSNNLPLADVTVSGGGSNTLTNVAGEYALMVPSGTYDVKAMKVGYNTEFITVNVENSDVVDADFVLYTYALETDVVWEKRSVCIFPYWFHYDSVGMDDCLTELREKFGNKFNYVDLRTVWDVDPADPNNVVYSPGQMESENGKAMLEAGFQKIHAHGYKVRLGLMSASNLYGGAIPSPTDWDVWWDNFRAYQVEVASWAESFGVEDYVMGWEMHFLDIRFDDGTFNSEWAETLEAIREVYSGDVTYEFNWIDNWSFSEEQLLSNTWTSGLDYISVSQYAPTSATIDPTVDEIVSSWTDNPNNGVNYIEAYRNLAEISGKKIQLNLGYSSSDGSCVTPWKSTGLGMDLGEQMNQFEGMFIALKDAEYVIGVDIEHFDRIYSGGEDITSGFRGKPAEAIIVQGLESYAPSEDVDSDMSVYVGVGLAFIVIVYILYSRRKNK